ncbi:MAG: HD domain-containing protein, partial [Desulfobacterales bacterium]|nr:HD domain-containing protein [Desulfobacterales bacterium]
MKISHRFSDISNIGPVYLVGGSVRDHILNRPSNDHDFAVPGDARAFAEKVATQLGVRVIEIGKNDETVYRVVSGDDTLDFLPTYGKSIEDDLKRRDFTVNGLGYDLRSERLIDPVGAADDIRSETIRLISQDAVPADPLRMLRAFRFAAVLGFEIAAETLAVIKKQRRLIAKPAAERICAEMFKMMEVERSFPYLEQMSGAGLLTEIIPELEPCRGCLQSRIGRDTPTQTLNAADLRGGSEKISIDPHLKKGYFQNLPPLSNGSRGDFTRHDHHEWDVFEHAMRTYEEIEKILSPSQADAAPWPEFAEPINGYLERNDHKVLLKWAALLHDVGKPQTRSVDSTGRVRFLRHEAEGAKIVSDICTRLRMSAKDGSYVTLVVEKHLRPLLLFDADQRGSLTSKGIVR